MPKATKRNPTFHARFDGWCHEGMDDILQGDEVMYDGTDRIVHVSCFRPRPVVARQDVICQKCFLARPCEHDEEKVP